MDEDIRALAASVAKGDMDALGGLYDLLSSRVFNYARTIVSDRAAAEDVTHDVFLRINAQAARIAAAAAPVAYIMTMARHHSYNLLRRERRFLPIDGGETDARPSPGDRLLFEDAFSLLPAVQRETAYLHLICGFTHKEVAGIQNAPVVTVKWRYGKALARLKEYFTENEKEDICNETL